ncbi:MAG: hypothetical protein QGH45_11915 [Myxococcota bacterium]|jgi:hypothetical protein|nr:hypothetical protein [Myxococcota bacterium]
MFSYVFMKILEGRPASYDRKMDAASQGRVLEMKNAVVAEVPEGSSVLESGWTPRLAACSRSSWRGSWASRSSAGAC